MIFVSLPSQSLFILNYPTQIPLLAEILPSQDDILFIWGFCGLQCQYRSFSLTCDMACVINCQVLQ